MKPLTIEELKALKVGGWVWVEYDEDCMEGSYVRICYIDDKELKTSHTIPANTYGFSDYGTTWLAYKNKEQAEATGEIVELPCLRDKPPIRYTGNEFIKRKELNYMTKDGTICSAVYWEDEFEEAERRLAELKGEN